MSDLSRNCRDGLHAACTGCMDCECHMGPPPMPLRELRDRIRAETQPEEAP